MNSNTDEDGFKRAQSLSYLCSTTIAAELRPGMTERQVAKRMDTFLQDHGVNHYFHRSFAWFGNRTRFDGIWNWLGFLPSKRELGEDDVVILDTAPIVDGYTGDTGFTFSLKPLPGLVQARNFLLETRQQIPALFASAKSSRKIWAEIDSKLKQSDYDNCHAEYPFRVLGHKVRRVNTRGIPDLLKPFSVHAYLGLLKKGLLPELLGPENPAPLEGLWAIEPHLGGKGFGAKFEEILVVDAQGARWLSDEVPHLHLPGGLC